MARVEWPMLVLGAVVILAGCDRSTPAPAVPAGWQTVPAGNAFTFRAPPDVKAVPAQGIDSFVGRYETFG